MEILTSFDPSILSRPPGWYEIKTLTKGPYPRGGHSGLYIQTDTNSEQKDSKGKVFLIGGADPDRAYNQTFVLDLNTMTWDGHSSGVFSARYEHSCYIPESYPNKIFIFGGADTLGNKNDVQVLDTKLMTWETIEVDGCQPSPRTQHHSASYKDYLVVYGGGDCGANAVSDSDVHIFNATTQSWSILSTTGKPPCSRHGHAMVAESNLIYIHGGMSGSSFYDDFYSLDMETCTWNEISTKGRKPSARAAHGAVAVNQQIYFFGGLCSKGALSDLYRFDIVDKNWTKINTPGKLPLPRLDFAICSINIELINSSNKDSTDDEHIQGSTKKLQPSWLSNTIALSPNNVGFFNCWCFSGTQMSVAGYHEMTNAPCKRHAIFVHGGMDTEGNIFDDILIYMI